MTERVISLIDMDCFYCQVEQRLDPERLTGKPAAVVQYNSWKGGGIIAVNYEARAFGVTRNMRGDEAKEKCPEIILVSVPEAREKADLSRYRDAGKEVIQVLISFGAVVERASVDEAYLDITQLVKDRMELAGRDVGVELLPNTHVVGHEKEEVPRWLQDVSSEDDRRLAVGAAIVEEMRAAVFERTKFRCSAGIAHNKMLAKFACGINKPNKQTILPQPEVPGLFETLKVTKLRGLGGKLGASIKESFNVETVADLAKLSLSDLKQRFEEKTATWLHSIAKGMEFEPVKERDLPKSIGCSKNFLGPKMLDTREKVEFWFGQLAEEVAERLDRDRETNGRVARGITASVYLDSDSRGNVSRAGPLKSYDKDQIARQALALVGSLNTAAKDPSGAWRPKLKNLSISACKFEDEDSKGTQLIADMFAASAKNDESDEANEAVQRAEELVPTLDDYDASLLEFLPAKIRTQVEKRVEMLRKESSRGVLTEKAKGGCFFNKVKSDADEKRSEEPSVQIKTENEPVMEKQTSIAASLDRVDCPKCSRKVSPFDLPEHLDFHMAQELQQQISRELPRPGTGSADGISKLQPKMTTTTSVGGKRKSSSAADRESKKQRNIKSFFQKQ